MEIAIFFISHWVLTVFCQTFFLHRYAAHKMFTLTPFMEKFFYLFTFFMQGSSFLNPRAYAILHREHHAYSDTPKDPHSPVYFKNVFTMMLATKKKYDDHQYHRSNVEKKFLGDYPEWPLVDSISRSWVVRIAFGVAYTMFYMKFATEMWQWALLPAHFIMGPIHGAIVNWGGHRYGYRNFNTPDVSVNSLPFDFLTFGELFQNNHHKNGTNPNFAARWFEVDPTYFIMKVFSAVGIIKLKEAPQPKTESTAKVA